MNTPKGMRKSRHIAVIVPIAIALVAVAAGAFFAIYHLVLQGGAGFQPRSPVGGPGADVTGPHFANEILFGVGALVLLLALMYGVWRTSKRAPAQERHTEDATRELYDREDAKE